ncbi:hypothetical protein FIV02_01545 [Pseudomonas sp. THAF187a]|uniref:hypothetical protein n=1 Tax=Pseudomonadaceae TaxID=135621 RepID=UPI0012A8D161|nr:hypothetical protein FIV02_01545 [Pseudomonas sp. THAF187a]QFT40444.1 hypothetical protein FIU98_01545 [Pseudomonas sp. THAF42]|tara:strand:+ start:123 stop:659 length:537 start_codon:yes stop_codon:yes gene_type:complete
MVSLRTVPAVIGMLLLSTGACAETGSEGSTIKESAKAAVSSAISAGKNLLGGITEGVIDGRESAQGADGAQVISNHEQMADIVQVDVLKTQPDGDNLRVTLGLKNTSATQLRLINLTQTGALLAIDADGYANPLLPGLQNPDEITVPANAGVRQVFIFAGPMDSGVSVRLWGQDYPVH